MIMHMLIKIIYSIFFIYSKMVQPIHFENKVTNCLTVLILYVSHAPYINTPHLIAFITHYSSSSFFDLFFTEWGMR